MTTAQAALGRVRTAAGESPAWLLQWPLALGVSAVAGLAWARGGATSALFLAGLVAAVLFGVFAASRDLARWGLIAWPALGALAYPFLRAGSLLTFDRLWIPALTAGVAWWVPRGRTPASPQTRLVLTLAAVFTLSFGLRAWTSSSGLGAMQTWVDAILLPSVVLLVARELIRTRDDFRRLLGGLAVAGGILAVIALLEFGLGFELASRSGGAARFDQAIDLTRVSGPYPDPEILCLALLVCYAATLGWVQLSRRPDRFLGGGILVALELTAIGITFFRAAWISAAIVTILCLALRRVRAIRLFWSAALLGSLVIVLALGLGTSQDLTTRLGDRQNVSGRIATWKQDLNVFAEHPAFGVGVNGFTASTTATTAAEFGGVQALDYPHNSYLGLLAEQGVVGLLPFLALTFAVWWLVRAFRRRSSALEDRVAAACVTGAAIAYVVMSVTLTMLPFGPSNALMALLVGGLAGRADEEAGGARS